jgi:hypothetical protein
MPDLEEARCQKSIFAGDFSTREPWYFFGKITSWEK